MTYTFKLARRLAMSRQLSMVPALILLAACAGDTTGPESTSLPIHETAVAGVRILPRTVTVETNQRIRFRGVSLRGRDGVTGLAWSATDGATITTNGTFSASTAGTYKVVGRGRGRNKPDTSVVVVVPPPTDLVAIEAAPDSVALAAGATHTFSAMGRLADGTTTSVGVTWIASGGVIDAGGVFKAGGVAGKFRVIATKSSGTLADTANVTIAEPVTSDTTTPPPPTLAKVFLTPASVSLVSSGTQKFAAYGRNSMGDSVAVPVTYAATGGSISSTGLFTAGSAGGTFRVVAREPVTGKVDTAAVTVSAPLPTTTTTGVPFGQFWLWSSNTTLKSDPAPFTVSIQSTDPAGVVTQINAARAMRQKLVLFMTGGAHSNYMTNGSFDLAKWKTRMDLFNTSTIKAAVADAVKDGTVIGNAIMDEPENTNWGGVLMTKPLLDQMAAYAKVYFPTLPMGVNHTTRYASWRTTERYHVVDYIWSPPLYWNTLAKGSTIAAWRDAVVAQATLDGVTVAWGLNPLDGGMQAARDGLWNCPLTTTQGRGTYAPNCRMTADQVRDWGRTLAQAPGCFLIMWAYDATYVGRADNQQAFKDLASTLGTKASKSCRRP